MRRLTAKMLYAVQYYCEPDSETYSIWTESYKKAGYSICHGWKHNAIGLLHKNYIQDAIKEYRDNMAKKAGWSVEIAQDMLLDDRKQAKQLKQPSAAISAVVAVNRMYGYDKDSHTDEDTKSDYTPEQQEQIDMFAKHLLIKDLNKEIA